MAESVLGVGKCSKPMEVQQGAEISQTAKAIRVEFVINTYADLQPFVEMAVLLLEGVYEHKKHIETLTLTPTKRN